jgi:hypothetical protein
VNWDEVSRKRTFPKVYTAKDLRPKQDRIDMEDLQINNDREAKRIHYRDKELKNVKEWSFCI